MKKNLFISAALACVAFSSCQQENLGANGAELDGFRVHTEDMTKAVLDGVKVVFEDEDAIDIYADNAETPAVYSYNKANDLFVATGTEAEGEEYTAIFPSAGSNASNSSVTIPDAYYGTLNSFPKDVTFMAGKSSSKELSLKHLIGLWEVDIMPEYTGQKLVRCFLTVDSKYKINGVFDIDWENYTLTHKSGGDNSILLRCDYSMTEGMPVKIFFALPEGTYEGGFSFTAVTTQGSMVKSSTSPLVIKRGQIMKVKNEVAYKTFESGSGTESDPYMIKTAQHWKNMAYYTQSYFKLDADIDFKNESVTPISTFKGTLDGGNFTVKNAKIGDGSASNQSFFPMLAGTVKNIKFDNIIVTGGNANGASSSAAVIVSGNNQNAFTLDNCHVTNSKVVSGPYEGNNGGSYAGGLVARYNNESAVINNCSVSSSTISCDAANAGGVVGFISKGIFKNIVSTGNKITAKGQYAGGVVGNISTANVSNIQSIGNNAEGSRYVGGVTGGVASGVMDNVFSSKNTLTSGSSYAGGVIGELKAATLINVVSGDNIIVVTSVYCGGVVAVCSSNDGKIINVLSEGNTVKSLSHNLTHYLGLILGTNATTYTNLLANTLVLSGKTEYVFTPTDDKKYAGCVGIVMGYPSATIVNSYYNRNLRGNFDSVFTNSAKEDENAKTSYRFAIGQKQNLVTYESWAGYDGDVIPYLSTPLKDGTCLNALNQWVSDNIDDYPTLKYWVSNPDDNGFPYLLLEDTATPTVDPLNVIESQY